MISLIIRTKNEERWIGQCIRRVLSQSTPDEVEIVVVDNQSTDKTLERALRECPDIRIVQIKEFFPGRAINEGIRASNGELLAILSAHCLPVESDWLASLTRNFNEPGMAGVYGRQIPTKFTSASDKRDLLLTFGLDRRIQQLDSFFHNANSMIRRDVWERFPFDEEVTNIEDRVWAKQVLEAGYTLAYEPEAPVYHHHGIHQNNVQERCENVVRIMENLELQPEHECENPLDPNALEITAIIPLRRESGQQMDVASALLAETICSAEQCKYIDRIIVSTDDPGIANQSRCYGAEAPFLRPSELALPDVRADQVLQHALVELETQGYFPDLVVPLEITYPFRPDGLLDVLIEQLLDQGLDSMVAGFAEYRPCWLKDGGKFVRVDDHAKKRDERVPLYTGLPSLGCVTYPQYVREGRRIGDNVGVYSLDDPIAAIEMRDDKLLDLFNMRRSVRCRSGQLAKAG